MASTKISAILILFSLLAYSTTYTEACGCGCTKPKPPTKPTPPIKSTPPTKQMPPIKQTPPTKTPPTKQTPPTASAPAPATQCPLDILKLGVCANVLGLVGVIIGNPPSGSQCCPLLQGLTDLEAAICLCTAIKASVLGINLNVPISLSVILSGCQKNVPSGFQCG